MDIEIGPRVVRNPAAIETTVGKEVVLMLIESGLCFGLGECGSEVWRQLAQPSTAAALKDCLHLLYDAPQGVIELDLEELLTAWSSNGLILHKQPDCDRPAGILDCQDVAEAIRAHGGPLTDPVAA